MKKDEDRKKDIRLFASPGRRSATLPLRPVTPNGLEEQLVAASRQRNPSSTLAKIARRAQFEMNKETDPGRKERFAQIAASAQRRLQNPV